MKKPRTKGKQMIEIIMTVQEEYNHYSVEVDGKLLCFTQDDDLGFALMVAKEKSEAQKLFEK